MTEKIVPFAQLGTVHLTQFPNLPHGAIFAFGDEGRTRWAVKVKVPVRPGEFPDGLLVLFPAAEDGTAPYLVRLKPPLPVTDVIQFQSLQLRPYVDTGDLSINAEPLNGELVSDGTNFHLCVGEGDGRLFFNFQTGSPTSPTRYFLVKRWALVAATGKGEELTLHEFVSPRLPLP